MPLHFYQACSPEGAAKIFELLNGKTFRSIGWSTLFDCLSIYEEKFKQSLQSPGAMFPEFQEGDAKALVAYLNVLQKVITIFSKTWNKFVLLLIVCLREIFCPCCVLECSTNADYSPPPPPVHVFPYILIMLALTVIISSDESMPNVSVIEI